MTLIPWETYRKHLREGVDEEEAYKEYMRLITRISISSSPFKPEEWNIWTREEQDEYIEERINNRYKF